MNQLRENGERLAMTPEDRTAYGRIESRLKSVLAAWRLSAAVRGLMLTAAAVSLILAPGYLLGAEGGARLAVIAAAGAAGLVIFAAGALWPLVRPLDLLDAAFLAGKKIPKLKNLLVSAVELYRETAAGDDPGRDAAMVSRLLRQAVSASETLKPLQVVDTRPAAYAALAAALALAVGAAGVVYSGGTVSGLAAWLQPPYLPEPETFALESVTGDVTVPVGGEARIEAVFSGYAGITPRLVLEREGLEPFEKQMQKVSSGGDNTAFAAAVPSVAGDMNYRVACRDFRSGVYHIFAVEPPKVRGISARLTYPAHTGILPDTKENAGDLRLPYGTRIDFSIESTTKLNSAWIQAENGDRTPLALSSPTAATGALTVKNDLSYTLHLRDTHDFPNRFPPQYHIESVPDEKPEVKLISPEEDLTVSKLTIVKIKGSARDDYGIAGAGLHVEISGKKKEETTEIPLTPGREALFEYSWDLDRVEAYEGDTIEYRISATDNDALTGPKTAYSETRRIRILSKFEDYREISRDRDDNINRLEATMREGENIANQFKDLAQKLDSPETSHKQWRADAERALERQKSLERELQDISESIEQSVQKMQNNELVNLDTLRKMQEVNRMMSEIMNDDIRKLMERIQQNLQRADTGKLDNEMLDRSQEQKKIMDRLDQTLERLKRIRTEQQLNALRDQLEDLAKRQENLTERTRALDKATGGKPPEGRQIDETARQAREQERIADETSPTLDALEKLAEDMNEMSPSASSELGEIVKTGRRAGLEENLENAFEQLSRRRPGDAVPEEEQASKKLRGMSNAVQDMSDRLATDMKKELKNLIRVLLRRTLDTSQAHEAAQARTEKIIEHNATKLPPGMGEELIDEEQVARETVEYLMRDVSRLAIMSMAIPPRATTIAEAAGEDLVRVVEELSEGRIPAAVNHQRRAARNFNQLALALLEGRRNAAQASSKSALDQYMEQLQKLAEGQKSLNDATSSLSDSGMPMPGMGDAMQQLAQQQRMLREGLSGLMDEMGRMSEMGKRLAQIEKEMEEIQRAMAGGDVDSETQRRQGNVLRRLQDASLSLRKEALEENRVAEKAKDYEAAPPEEIKDLLMESLPPHVRRELERLREQPRPEGYERLIEKYYNELMRGRID